MAGKQLSEQQQRRIAKREQAVIDNYTTGNSNHYHTGRVIGSHGHNVIIEIDAQQTLPCKWHRDRSRPVCGDQVLWLYEDERNGMIEAVLPRSSLLERPDSRGHLRPVAANIDRLGIVIANSPPFNEGLLDRYLVAASIIDVTPLIIVNKTDLLDAETLASIKQRLAIYAQLGYEILFTSAKQIHGLDALQQALREHTVIFVGQSGVGKSSLINGLLPEAGAEIGDISTATGKGRHTTTTASLYHLPCGGKLIDSPGVREFGLTHAAAAEVEQAYPEILKAARHCRFHNCRHTNEPGCAVHTAVEQGEIDEGRFARYQAILNSLAGE
ncbi:MAG: ribosome small subunit-dependent GTPase A [Granulosicoccaceae bacterium]|jgi:ribosome biogenesis GTPase